MSMRYNAVDEYGLVIDEETAKYMIEKLCAVIIFHNHNT